MDSSVENHIEMSLSKIRAMFVRIAEEIDKLSPDGKEKIPATVLAEKLGQEFDMTGPQIYPIFKIMLNEKYPGVKILRGAHGGICKIVPENKVIPIKQPMISVSEQATISEAV